VEIDALVYQMPTTTAAKEASAMPSFEEYLRRKGGVSYFTQRSMEYDDLLERASWLATNDGIDWDSLDDDQKHEQADALAYEILKDGYETFLSLGEPLTLYRAVKMDLGRPLETDGFGVYWTWDENSAIPHGAPSGGKTYVFRGSVRRSDVDWDDTLTLQLTTGQEENEIRLKNFVQVKIIGYRLKNETQWHEPESNFRTVTSALDEIAINENPDGRIIAKHPLGVVMGLMEDTAGFAKWLYDNDLPEKEAEKYVKVFILAHISVRGDQRRKGIGRALVGAVLDAAKAGGAEVCFLFAQSLTGLSSKELGVFYTGLGFQPVGGQVFMRKLAGIPKYAALNTISQQDAIDKKMFGPVYHGTTEERQEQIGNEGFKVYVGEAGSGDIAHGYQSEGYYEGIPAPVHHLGYGVYFTTNKNIAKDFAGGTTRGMKTYYLDVPRLETINFGVPKTMMKWWIGQGYDKELAKTNRVEATKKMTEHLKSQFDAVWFKGKGLQRLLDGDQICVFDPNRIHQVDPNLAKPGDIGSKVKRKADWMKGTIVGSRTIPQDVADEYWGGETRVYSVKWQKGGTDNNVKGSQIEFLGVPKAQGATASF